MEIQGKSPSVIVNQSAGKYNGPNLPVLLPEAQNPPRDGGWITEIGAVRAARAGGRAIGRHRSPAMHCRPTRDLTGRRDKIEAANRVVGRRCHAGISVHSMAPFAGKALPAYAGFDGAAGKIEAANRVVGRRCHAGIPGPWTAPETRIRGSTDGVRIGGSRQTDGTIRRQRIAGPRMSGVRCKPMAPFAGNALPAYAGFDSESGKINTGVRRQTDGV